MLGRLAFRIDLHTCLAADVFVPVQLRLERKKKSSYQVNGHAWDSRPEKGMPASEVATKLPCEVSW